MRIFKILLIIYLSIGFTQLKSDENSQNLKNKILYNFNKFVDEYIGEYSKKRNFDFGNSHKNVSKLSPYIRRRLLSENEIIELALSKHPLNSLEKFIQEIYWRTYWRGWLELHPKVYTEYEIAKKITDIPVKTGIKCFDHWTQELVETGYLHNHARMWYASIWVFTLNRPWEDGAKFFSEYLIDWCPASNTLGWRWVAGLQTVGKNYLATADNIKLFTNNRFNPKGQLTENHSPILSSKNLNEEVKGFLKDKVFVYSTIKNQKKDIKSKGKLISKLSRENMKLNYQLKFLQNYKNNGLLIEENYIDDVGIRKLNNFKKFKIDSTNLEFYKTEEDFSGSFYLEKYDQKIF